MALRETKKAATRTAIADAATGLFLARGFDRVTVIEVAEAAGVSVNTVFNYFRTKEDLFFDRQDEVVGRLARAVTGRNAGESAVAAVRRMFLDEIDRDDPTLGIHPGALDFRRVIDDSPALQSRARRLAEDGEAALAEALAGDPLAHLVAAVLAGIDRALHAEIHRRITAGDSPAVVRDAIRDSAVRGFGLAERGVGDRPA